MLKIIWIWESSVGAKITPAGKRRKQRIEVSLLQLFQFGWTVSWSWNVFKNAICSLSYILTRLDTHHQSLVILIYFPSTKVWMSEVSGHHNQREMLDVRITAQVRIVSSHWHVLSTPVSRSHVTWWLQLVEALCFHQNESKYWGLSARTVWEAGSQSWQSCYRYLLLSGV